MADPNVSSYEPLPDSNGWAKIGFDDGSAMHVHDPDGSFKSQVDDILAKTGSGGDQAGRAQAAADEFSPQALQATAVPDLSIARSAANDFSPQALADAAQAPPAPVQAGSPPPGALPSVGGPPGATATPPVPSGPIMIPGTPGAVSSESGSTVSGYSKKDKADIVAREGIAQQSQRDADAANVDTQTAVRAHAYQTAVAHQAELQGQFDQQKAEAQKKQQLVDDGVKRIQAINAKPIDPQAAFRDNDLGAYALMASIGQGIANFGARISGNGNQAEDVLKPINDIIDRSVKIQTAQKQADFEAGKISLAEYQAEVSAATSHLYALGNQLTLAQQHTADTEEEKMGIASLSAQLKAKQDAAAVDAAKANADHVTTTNRTTRTPGVAGHQATPAETAALYQHIASVSKDNPQLGNMLAQKLGIDMGAAGGEQGSAPIKAMDPEEKKDARTRLDGISEIVNNVKEIDKNVGLTRDDKGNVNGQNHPDVFGAKHVFADAAHSLPFHVGDAAEGLARSGMSPATANVRSARDLLAAAKAKANFARTTEVELKLMQDQLPLGNSGQFTEGIRRTEDEARQTVNNLRAQYGRGFVDSELKQRGIDPGQF